MMRSTDRDSRFKRLLCVRIVSCIGALALLGYTIDRPPIAQLVDLAADVAVVEVIWEEPVTFEYESAKFVCGCRYGARVVEAFKGEQGELQFATARCSAFRGYDRKYFVITETFDEIETESLRTRELAPWESELSRARQLCVVSASTKLVQAGQPAMVPFGTRRDDAGEEWLVVDRDSVVSYGPYRRRQEVVDGRTLDLVSWKDIRAELERAIGGAAGRRLGAK